MKWNIELSQYDITYHPRREINGQALADFIAEYKDKGDSKEEVTNDIPIRWKLYVDGARNDYCSRAGVVLKTPEGRSYAML